MIGKTVFVGLSGGVDSSVAALRLKNAGYNVVGVFIRVWHPDFIECTEERDRLDAMRVAATLGIPFLTCDAREAYKTGVADEMIREYRAGRTPNPDVLCNKVIKFGVFNEFRKQYGADYIATGHYARVEAHKDAHVLKTGTDSLKDQSYFLWMMKSAVLSHVLFPIGDTVKVYTRNEARHAMLPTAEKRDSQGICFLGKLNMKEFLSHYIQEEHGAVEDEAGKVIGEHNGSLFFTIGERHGFTITAQSANTAPFYVVQKDMARNVVVVSNAKPEVKTGTRFEISSMNLLTPELLEMPCEVVTRYHGPRRKATITKTDAGASITLEEAGEPAQTGQSCVIYSGDMVVAGGIIEARI